MEGADFRQGVSSIVLCKPLMLLSSVKRLCNALFTSQIRSLREAGISQATDMASTFTTSLGSTSSDAASQLEEVLKKATERLEEIKGEGVHVRMLPSLSLFRACKGCFKSLSLLITIGFSGWIPRRRSTAKAVDRTSMCRHV